MAQQDYDNEEYDFSDSNTVAFLTSQKHKFEKQRDKVSAEANTTERSLSGQLILLTTVLITVNVIALGNGELLNHLTNNQKILIILSFIFEMLATVAGIIHYFKMESSYNKWGDAYHRVTQIIDGKDFKTEKELSDKIQAAQTDLKIHPVRPALKLQVGCIIGSFLVYLVLLLAVFFNFHNTFTIF
jgi:hypothetical protein